MSYRDISTSEPASDKHLIAVGQPLPRRGRQRGAISLQRRPRWTGEKEIFDNAVGRQQASRPPERSDPHEAEMRATTVADRAVRPPSTTGAPRLLISLP